jgi:hypothetical protein
VGGLAVHPRGGGKTAISLLNTAGFDGALEEFLDSHEHYRNGKMKEAMSIALKAFESTMKATCDEGGWSYKEGDTAKTLVKAVLDNGLVPHYMETHLAGLRASLEAGLPTVRNKNSGTGRDSSLDRCPTTSWARLSTSRRPTSCS